MEWLQPVIGFLSVFERAFIVTIAGFLIAKLSYKALRWAGREFHFDSVVLPVAVEQALYASTVIAVIISLGLAWIVAILFAILFLGVAISAIAMVWAGVPNLHARSQVRDALRIGERVRLGPVEGVVERLGAFSVRLRGDGLYDVPNVFALKAIRED